MRTYNGLPLESQRLVDLQRLPRALELGDLAQDDAFVCVVGVATVLQRGVGLQASVAQQVVALQLDVEVGEFARLENAVTSSRLQH